MSEGGRGAGGCYIGHHKEEGEGGNFHMNGKHILVLLWKTEILKSETEITSYCGN
jgi:hypothetical protein